ncbi:uncharacterized protein LOC128893680 [Hylaeus anthracinus]|uniref:uncharacterized protein LOC128893680 n=1 Tax=Hylaeus anthracinus TaxID=313031 RepID=UPI0023B94563|nr:uncharacterized protein LOC128893680 [Hylaeus anthracinus]
MTQWRIEIQSAITDRPIVRALLPILEVWCRKRPRFTYRVTQVLTGKKGCFGQYLHSIGREPTAECHHFEEALDTVRHTLEECPAWSAPRRVLISIVGADLSLSALVDHLAGGGSPYRAVVSFCEYVMSQNNAGWYCRSRGMFNHRPGSKRKRGSPETRGRNRKSR